MNTWPNQLEHFLISRASNAFVVIFSPGLDEHILAGPYRVDKTLETNVNRAMVLVQHTSANTIDTGGIACEYLRSPIRLRRTIKTGREWWVGEDLQHGEEEKNARVEDRKSRTGADELLPCSGGGDVESSKGESQDVEQK